MPVCYSNGTNNNNSTVNCIYRYQLIILSRCMRYPAVNGESATSACYKVV